MKTRVKSHSRIQLVALTAMVILAISFIPNAKLSWVASAQDPASPVPSPTPDEELERLKRETALSTEKANQADNAKKIAEAQKAARLLRLFASCGAGRAGHARPVETVLFDRIAIARRRHMEQRTHAVSIARERIAAVLARLTSSRRTSSR